ncbi:ATP-binding protein [Hyphomicrobium sp. LHD-15]|uniref:ATP-binding protein n=1 Tax=Hyphomicrobium sp. LHD-15 TaxID=3072142 RepID=UPI00280CCDB4|nr:ATP-binding protein [Hyphomicrobium sp. LHD-15]MDQ8697496.1 ATP-binding protein [Hyphomicrobium sp. LHD-15]
MLGNVTFLERPFHPLTFLSVARTASKGRYRQYDAKARIQELADSKQFLEERVVERTAELSRAHQAVLAEIAQREEAEKRLRHSQKMELIGQLTGGVAHDFNNLLMAVIGNLDLIRKRLPSDLKLDRLIDGAMQGAQRGAALTQRLLAFARRQDLQVEPTNVAELLRGMNDLIERSIGRQIELVVTVPTGLSPVLVDPVQVELAILNLVVNARDAMPSGGVLTVEASEEATLGDRQEASQASYVCVTVTDTGCGMDEETLQKATEPFFSTKELGKGTGLGLSMVHGLARQLDGALKLSSEVGVGTRAELWLPTTTMPIAKHNAQSESPADRARAMNVLVVDDDALISMSTAMMVEDLGHTVVEVNSALQALDMLRNGKKIDLLITDFSMPKMNGAQLAAAAKELRPDLPVLLATGYADLPQGTGADFPRIAKPFQQDQLAAAIANVMASAAHRE